MTNILFTVDGQNYRQPAPSLFEFCGLLFEALTGGRIMTGPGQCYRDRERRAWKHHANRLQADIDRQNYRRAIAERPERVERVNPNGLNVPERPERLNELNELIAFGEPVPNEFIKELQAEGYDVANMTTEELETLLWYDMKDNLPWWETSH